MEQQIVDAFQDFDGYYLLLSTSDSKNLAWKKTEEGIPSSSISICGFKDILKDKQTDFPICDIKEIGCTLPGALGHGTITVIGMDGKILCESKYKRAYSKREEMDLFEEGGYHAHHISEINKWLALCKQYNLGK